MFYICSHEGKESTGLGHPEQLPQRKGVETRSSGAQAMTITIHVEGATSEEIIRGLIAAQEVFDKAGVMPEEAATASFVVEGWDIRISGRRRRCQLYPARYVRT